jgi:hypothetical protein
MQVNQIIIEISKLAAHTPLENIYLSPQYITLMKSKVKDGKDNKKDIRRKE